MYYHESGRRKSIYFWMVILVIFVVILNIPSVKRSSPLHAARSLAGAVAFPVKYVFNGLYNNTTSFFGNIYALKSAEKENEGLSAELKEYKARSVLLDNLSAENEKLRLALSFRARSFVLRLLPAEIIGRSGSSWFNIVEINRGFRRQCFSRQRGPERGRPCREDLRCFKELIQSPAHNRSVIRCFGA